MLVKTVFTLYELALLSPPTSQFTLWEPVGGWAPGWKGRLKNTTKPGLKFSSATCYLCDLGQVI